jgi:hypothetical protein
VAEAEDDTVIYLDPKRSESMSLCQSYGDSSAGYGAFNDIVEAWKNSVRLYSIVDLQGVDGTSTYFDSTRFKREGLDEFQPWSSLFPQSVAKALEAGIWSNDIDYRGRGYRALHRALFHSDDDLMKEHPSKYKILETCLLVYGVIGYVAVKRIYRWLSDSTMKADSPMLELFEKIRSDAKLDQPLFGIETPSKDAQQALDWLVKHRGFYELCSKKLFQVVCEVGIFASPITKYSRFPDAPKIPDEGYERYKMLYEYLDADKIYSEFLNEGEIIEVAGSPLRLYSLYSRQHYLGIGTSLHYSVGLQDKQTKIPLDIDIVDRHLGIAEEYLQTADRKELEYQFNKCSAIMQIEHRKQWEERLRDLEDLAEAQDFINDLVHAIGFLATDDPSEEDVIGDQLAKLMTLPAKIEPWVTIAEGGPIQQLGAYFYQATNGEEVPSQSQPNQDQPSNDLVSRLSEAIESINPRKGCTLTCVGHALMGDVRDKSLELRNWLVGIWGDAQYARKKGAKSYPTKRPPITSFKYQELVKLWDEKARTKSYYECKEEYKIGDGEILEFWSPKSSSKLTEPSMKVAKWLVENVDNDALEKQLG